jgi:hypothetical protein
MIFLADFLFLLLTIPFQKAREKLFLFKKKQAVKPSLKPFKKRISLGKTGESGPFCTI